MSRRRSFDFDHKMLDVIDINTQDENEPTSLHDYKNGDCELLNGSWKAGWALDLHTISSIMLPNGHF
jgi:hypothetical protein